MRNRFPSVNRIQNFREPLIQFHGTEDEVIPFELGKQLFEAAASVDKEFIEVEDREGRHLLDAPGLSE